jgi:hypothetical protein
MHVGYMYADEVVEHSVKFFCPVTARKDQRYFVLCHTKEFAICTQNFERFYYFTIKLISWS